MKKLLLSFTILFLTNFNLVAQDYRLSIQGIARDAEGASMINKELTLDCTIYYLNDENAEIVIKQDPKDVNTDAFGVFDVSIISGHLTNSDKYNTEEVRLRIKNNDIVIMDDVLTSVPYSISSYRSTYATHATHGVPVGTIVAMITSSEESSWPEGWALCKGQDMNGEKYDRIRSKFSDGKIPNLTGYFLRGAGGNAGTHSTKNITLGKFYDDTFKEHKHGRGTLVTSNAGKHTPQMIKFPVNNKSGMVNVGDHYTFEDTSGSDEGWKTVKSPNNTPQIMQEVPHHTHAITGQTALTGDDKETAPVSYGVYWFIKL